MQQWEYQVIHLNVDSSAPAKDGVSGPAESPTSTPPFTKTYLEQEFPSHYGPQQPPGAAAVPPAQQPKHPAMQLQGFINSHGRQGWELLGIFPLGSLLMMIFRRPLPSQAGTGVNKADSADIPWSEKTPPLTPPSKGHKGASLETVLDRLEALESRLSALSPPSAMAAEPPKVSPPSPPPPGDHGRRPVKTAWILGEEHLRKLKDHPVWSTAQAARSLGFRSPASLLNPASLHGYPIGLVRTGPNGKVAVYQGLAPNRQGGRDLRLWLVVESHLLPPEPN